MQNISPGLVATDFMASYSMFSAEAMAAMPTLDPNDVANAVTYVLSNPPHVLACIRCINLYTFLSLSLSLNISSYSIK